MLSYSTLDLTSFLPVIAEELPFIFPHWPWVICLPLSLFTVLLPFPTSQRWTQTAWGDLLAGGPLFLKLFEKIFGLLPCYSNISPPHHKFWPLIMFFYQGQTLNSEVMNAFPLDHIQAENTFQKCPRSLVPWPGEKVYSLKSVANNRGSHMLPPGIPKIVPQHGIIPPSTVGGRDWP